MNVTATHLNGIDIRYQNLIGMMALASTDISEEAPHRIALLHLQSLIRCAWGYSRSQWMRSLKILSKLENPSDSVDLNQFDVNRVYWT